VTKTPSLIFIHGTDIVDIKGLIVLFFDLLLFFGLFLLPPLWKRLNSAIFRYFFPVGPPGKFTADALDGEGCTMGCAEK